MLITSTVIACSVLWAIIASVMAYNRGREIHVMAERHNSVVEALNEKSGKLDYERMKWAKQRNETENHYLKGLQKIDQLTADRDQLQAKINAIGVVRDPKTGRFVNPTRLLCDEVKANAVTDIVPKPQVYRSKVLNIGFDARKGCDVVTTDETYSQCEMPNDPYVQRSIEGGDSIVHNGYCYTTTQHGQKSSSQG